MKAEGVNGYIELRGDSIILTRKLFFGKGKGEKQIKISSITAFQFRPAGLLTSGYLQVAFSGSSESKKGLFDAANDENTIMFKKSQQPAFEAIREAVEAGQPGKPASTGDLSDQLAKLAALREAGALDEAEFAAAKARLLS